MWSRPRASGPQAPERTSSLSATATRSRSPSPSQQIRAGQPLERDALAGELDPGPERVGADDVHDDVLAPAEVVGVAR